MGFYDKICSSAANRIFHNELLDNFVFDMLFQTAMLPRISFPTNLTLYKTEAYMDLYLKARWNYVCWSKKSRC